MTRIIARALAALALAFAATTQPALAQGYASCGDTPSAYIDPSTPGAKFDDYNNTSGFPVFNSARHCYGYAIYSASGKDTFTTPADTRRVTNSGYGYQCAELAYRYFLFRFHTGLSMGAAADLCDGPLPDNVHRFKPGSGEDPVPGDIIVFARGKCGADATYGHIAVVTRWWNKDSIQIAQQNTLSETTTIANVATACACAFLHATGTDGNHNVNGSPVATPPDTWKPSGTTSPGLNSGGGSPSVAQVPVCHCTSADPDHMWPVCCKLRQ